MFLLFWFPLFNNVESVARERGTTITLRELFGSFPVRKQEFNKNIMG